MNYKKMICFFALVAINLLPISPAFKNTKIISDISGLTVLLQRKGYEILSSKQQNFEALKKYPIKTIFVDDNPTLSQQTDSCKITALNDDNFFVEITIAESKEVLGDYQKATIFQEEGFELKEESCKVHKETAYVLSFERAIQFVASFYQS